MAPNLSECNISHGGIAPKLFGARCIHHNFLLYFRPDHSLSPHCRHKKYIYIQSCPATTRLVITLIGCNAVGRASRFFSAARFFFYLVYIFLLQIALSFMYFATMYFYHYVYCIFIRICFIALCRKIAH